MANAENLAQEKLVLDAQQFLAVNNECNRRLVDIIKPGLNVEHSESIADDLTIKLFYKCSASLLTTLIKVKILENLTETLIVRNKGKSHEVTSGSVYQKTK